MIVIEHNLDVIKTADWVIDLGPDLPPQPLPHFPHCARKTREGLFGIVVAMGTPEEVAAVEGSWTGRYLKGMLAKVTAR